MPDATIPAGLCQCGCGRKTRITAKTCRADGRIKGQPLRFVHGHNGGRSVRWLDEDRGYATPCRIWQGRVDENGYGRFDRDGVKVLAHRQLWIDTHGPVPDGLFVCHHCDQPPCGRLDHLFLGDAAANNADRDAKGRQARGERNGKARLTEADVRVIRATVGHRTYREIAEAFGVSQGAIWSIAAGLTWKWLV